MSQPVAVDCIFDQDGRIRVRRIKPADRWLNVEQGRQWTDENGRHVLIMVSGSEVQEILLSPVSLQWRLLVRRGHAPLV